MNRVTEETFFLKTLIFDDPTIIWQTLNLYFLNFKSPNNPQTQKHMTNKVEELFKDNYALLCLVSFSIVKDRDAAKDIVQDFFVSIWNKRDTLNITTSFEAYARRSVKNLSLLYLEKEKKVKKIGHELDMVREDTQPLLDKPKKNSKLYDLLNQMPDKRKEIFISFVVQGKSYSEIAESNGVSINTVKTQMKRAYAFLRTHKKQDFVSVILISSSFF